MTIDWTKPICIAATDWQEELPARVVSKDDDGDYRVEIDAPHKVLNGGHTWPSGESWYCGADGEVTGYPEIWVINKIEKDNKMPTQKSLDEARANTTLEQSIAAHALTLDQLHGRVEVSEAERLYREIVGVAYHYSGQSISRELDKDDLAAIAILEKALADAKDNATVRFETVSGAMAYLNDGWIEWHGGDCPVAPDTRVEVKFLDGTTDDKENAGLWFWGKSGGSGQIIAYRVL